MSEVITSAAMVKGTVTNLQVVHVNLTRLIRRLDKSVNEADRDTGRSAMLQIGEWATGTSLAQALPSFLSYRARPSVTRKPDPLTIQRLAPSHVTSRLLTTGPAPWLGRQVSSFLPPDRTPFHERRAQYGWVTRGPASASALAAAGRRSWRRSLLRWQVSCSGRNAKHFSGIAGGGRTDQGVLRAVEERVSVNLEAAKQVWVRVHDHHGKALGTTCLTISSVVFVAITFLTMFFVIRFT
ncbi:hypothetical protein EDB87DRAFT_1691295 [Lactarius vividus]|nr:hypothetical protein EDB87DRAFT_1691295 [Lactarius vividus]